jgi:hypothetical protein
MNPKVSGRIALKCLCSAAAAPLLGSQAAAASPHPRWQTAIDLNSFVSSARKYNLRILQVAIN